MTDEKVGVVAFHGEVGPSIYNVELCQYCMSQLLVHGQVVPVAVCKGCVEQPIKCQHRLTEGKGLCHECYAKGPLRGLEVALCLLERLDFEEVTCPHCEQTSEDGHSPNCDLMVATHAVRRTIKEYEGG